MNLTKAPPVRLSVRTLLCSTFALAAAAANSLALANSGHGDQPTGTAPGIVLKELEAGNKRFIENDRKHPNEDPVRRRTLATGQKPEAIVLSCSDSRVPPEVVFDKGLGELFVIRVAGNVLGAATVASIEYALEHLGTRLIVVMGHESCGAVKAALTTPANASAGSPDLDTLISAITPHLSSADRAIAAGGASHDKTIRRPVMDNVNGVAKRLLQRSSIVRTHVESGKVAIVPAIYGLESGLVDFWNTDALKKSPPHEHSAPLKPAHH